MSAGVRDDAVTEARQLPVTYYESSVLTIDHLEEKVA
jgi:hypothetical protein